MDAAEVIHQIESLPPDEVDKVINFMDHFKLKRYEDEQVKIAIQRLDDLENGLDEEIPHEEAMKQIRAK